jgi:hypothetical protein
MTETLDTLKSKFIKNITRQRLLQVWVVKSNTKFGYVLYFKTFDDGKTEEGYMMSTNGDIMICERDKGQEWKIDLVGEYDEGGHLFYVQLSSDSPRYVYFLAGSDDEPFCCQLRTFGLYESDHVREISDQVFHEVFMEANNANVRVISERLYYDYNQL